MEATGRNAFSVCRRLLIASALCFLLVGCVSLPSFEDDGDGTPLVDILTRSFELCVVDPTGMEGACVPVEAPPPNINRCAFDGTYPCWRPVLRGGGSE